MFELAQSDLDRKRTHYSPNSGFVERYVKVTLQLGTLAVLGYRLGHWAHSLRPSWLRALWLLPYHGLNFLVRWLTGTDIRHEARIGEGFIIHNFSAIFIDAREVGKNFTINQGVSVGPDWRNNVRPVIGDNVNHGARPGYWGESPLARMPWERTCSWSNPFPTNVWRWRVRVIRVAARASTDVCLGTCPTARR